MVDFNDFFKSENKCSECGQTLNKSTVAEDNKKSKKHAGSGEMGKFADHPRGKGGNSHKKTKIERSETAAQDQEQTFQKAFPVSDSFQAVQYVNESGSVFSTLEQLQAK